VYGDGSKVGFDKLMKVENACARVVLGAINSTPIHTLWSEMGDSPLNVKSEFITVRETVRMITKNNCLVNEIITAVRGGTNHSNTNRSKLVEENINIFSKIRSVSAKVPPNNLVVCLQFGGTTKAMMNELSVEREFCKMRLNYFAHVEVYTDASVNDDRVGVGINIPTWKIERVMRLNDSICIMNAELIGILEGIKLAMNEGRRRVVLFSDSLSGLKLIKQGGGPQGNVYVELLYEYLQSCGTEVILQWIPSHLQIKGNERADMLAKRGCLLEEINEYEFMDARDVLRMFQVNLWRKWESEFIRKSQVKGKKYFELCSTPLKKPFFKEIKGSTTMIRTMERVRLNHGNWKECLKKRRLIEDDLCERCLVVEDIEHLLINCSQFRDSRQMFDILSNARNLTELLRMGKNEYKMMYEFIKMNEIIV
jgi:ribonuclease HI